MYSNIVVSQTSYSLFAMEDHDTKILNLSDFHRDAFTRKGKYNKENLKYHY